MTTLRLKYNPSHMPEDDLIRSFVVRERDLAAILETVRENTGASNQHLLILGPRGMGKTTLINRAVAEIRRTPELNKLWYPILFDEESYTVTSAGELWFQALSHLADQTRDPDLEKARRALQTVTDRTRLRDASLARLLEFADAHHKRLLLAFENVDMLFDDQMVDDDGWDIRHTLQNEPRIMVLATSTTRLDSFHDSKKPLYELFREHTLERLDLEECRTVWHLVTGAELPLNQARPIQIFTGGNTRLLTILAAFAKDRSFRELMDDLVGLIDENTSYFKHNIEALAPESRKIFVTLADLWSPATSRQVADQTRGDIRAVSAQLGRLADQGIIEVVRRVDRTQMFQVSERMYNLYYLLRRRGSGRVRAVVEFIVRYYDRDGVQRMLTSMAHEACELGPGRRDDNIQAFTELLRRIPDAALRLTALQGTPTRFLHLPDVADLLPSMERRMPEAAQRSEPELLAHLLDNPVDIVAISQLADLLNARGASNDVLDIVAPALTLAPPSTIIENLTIALMTHYQASDTVIEVLGRAVAAVRQANHPCAYPGLALMLISHNELSEAREIANESLERWPDNPMTAAIVGCVFRLLGERVAAANAFIHALELDPANIIAAEQRTSLLIEQGEIGAAELHVRGCLEHLPRRLELWLSLSDILAFHRTNRESALDELVKAEALFPDHTAILERIGDLQLQLDRFAAAEATYRRLAIDLGSDFGTVGLTQSLIHQKKFAEARAVLGPHPPDSPGRQIAVALVELADNSDDDALRHLRAAGSSSLPNLQSLVLTVTLQLRFLDITGARTTMIRYLAGPEALRLPRLYELSLFVLELQHTAFEADVVLWARELSTKPSFAQPGNLLLARALALTKTWDELWAPLGVVFDDASFATKHLSRIVHAVSVAAAHGHAARALAILAASPSAPHFEPLLVALRRLAGEPTNPPQEVSEVADDIVRDIERLRETVATSPTPSPAPAPPRPAPPTTKHHQLRQQHKRSRRRVSIT